MPKRDPAGLVAQFHGQAEDLGREPKMAEFVAYAGTSDSTIRRIFGSWVRFKAVATGAEGAPTVEVTASAEPQTFHRSEDDVRRMERGDNFVVTSAVSSSPVDPGFWAALQHLARNQDAQLVVNPVRYKNPTRRGEEREDEWWAEEVLPHLLESELRPHPYLSIMPTKVQATANNPLPPRLSGLTKARSAVFGHPQLAMRTVATPQEELPKLLYSSGACTQKRYSDTIAGEVAGFHHSLAAVIVQVRGSRFHLREVTWDGERFIDLDVEYTEHGARPAQAPLALVLGDVHVGQHDPDVHFATFGSGGLCESLGPRHLVLHDLFDGLSVNPHDRGKRLTRAVRQAHGINNLESELHAVAEWVNALPPEAEVVVVPSNHDDFLMRWLERGEDGVEPENRYLYHWLSWMMLRDANPRTGEMPNPLELALADDLDHPRVRFLKMDESFRLGNIELGMHGHLGPNGARGTIRNLSQIGTRSVVGHSHSPGIWQGVYQAGTNSNYRLGYNPGPSSWLHSDVLVHANGRRQMVHFVGGRWHG